MLVRSENFSLTISLADLTKWILTSTISLQLLHFSKEGQREWIRSRRKHAFLHFIPEGPVAPTGLHWKLLLEFPRLAPWSAIGGVRGRNAQFVHVLAGTQRSITACLLWLGKAVHCEQEGLPGKIAATSKRDGRSALTSLISTVLALSLSVGENVAIQHIRNLPNKRHGQACNYGESISCRLVLTLRRCHSCWRRREENELQQIKV